VNFTPELEKKQYDIAAQTGSLPPSSCRMP
jgi:hypothetical protein